MNTDILDFIAEYFHKRGLKWPTFDEAMKFVQTEIAEVYELDLARIGGFVRNNPQDKEQFSKERLAEELGDAILMLLVAGMTENLNPLEAMENKMRRKLGLPQIKTSPGGGIQIGSSPLVVLSQEEAEDEFGVGILHTGTWGNPDIDGAYDYTQDDLNFDAERERRSR